MLAGSERWRWNGSQNGSSGAGVAKVARMGPLQLACAERWPRGRS
jgi:hypothetical protein